MREITADYIGDSLVPSGIGILNGKMIVCSGLEERKRDIIQAILHFQAICTRCEVPASLTYDQVGRWTRNMKDSPYFGGKAKEVADAMESLRLSIDRAASRARGEHVPRHVTPSRLRRTARRRAEAEARNAEKGA